MKPLVKICGIKSADEARAVLKAGAKFGRNLGSNLDVFGADGKIDLQNGVSFLGVIFAPSKRKVTPQIAREIANLAHDYGVKCVGVFAEISENEILEICKEANLDVAQIYGEYSANLRQNLARESVKIWKVYSVLDALPSVDLESCDMPLFDCKGVNLGGNGVSFEWGILEGVKFDFALAGGIGEDNVRDALKFNPLVLDINSKVENENGIKEPKKIEEVLKILSKYKSKRQINV